MGNRARFSRILPRLSVGLLLMLGAIGESGPAWAWGDLGHKIVCQIAFQELNDKARAEVIRLIMLDEKFDSFTDACTWPDHPRQRAEEHFINVPRTLQATTTTQCQGTPTCLFTAIVSDREVLRTSTDDQAKLASGNLKERAWPPKSHRDLLTVPVAGRAKRREHVRAIFRHVDYVSRSVSRRSNV